MSNIAEGFERGGNKEFQQFLSVAKGSAGEVKAQLYVSLDTGYIKKGDFSRIYELADETSRLIGGFIRYLAKSKHRGVKFK
jgi:four helix bundle protein